MNYKQTKQGFTLIELLVVVLIIGILAAVALPQYQKAVEKSKATQALALLKSIYQARNAYYLANGKYPKSLDDIDIDLPLGEDSYCSVGSWQPGREINSDWALCINDDSIKIERLQGRYKHRGALVSTVITTTGSEPKEIEEIFCLHDEYSYPERYCTEVLGKSNVARRSTPMAFYYL